MNYSSKNLLEMNLTDKAEKFMENVNLSIVFDHARAGNMFFLTLF